MSLYPTTILGLIYGLLLIYLCLVFRARPAVGHFVVSLGAFILSVVILSLSLWELKACALDGAPDYYKLSASPPGPHRLEITPRHRPRGSIAYIVNRSEPDIVVPRSSTVWASNWRVLGADGEVHVHDAQCDCDDDDVLFRLGNHSGPLTIEYNASADAQRILEAGHIKISNSPGSNTYHGMRAWVAILAAAAVIPILLISGATCIRHYSGIHNSPRPPASD